MIIQRLLYPTETICDENEMYFNGENYLISDNKIIIQENGRIDTDTYFNSVSINKWNNYTKLSNLKLTLNITGKCTVFLCYGWIDEKNIIRRKGDNVVFYEKTKSEEALITLEFPEHKEGTIAYFRVMAKEEPVFIEEGYYETDINETDLRDVSIAIGICTFKREEFIEKNVKTIKNGIFKNSNSALYEKLDVYISDNGQTLDIEKLQEEHIYVFPNKNLGGSGGFTRCIIEALNQIEEKKYTHIILMDDDILLDCNVLERNYNFLRLLKEEYKDALIGGGMLVLDCKYRQFENAANYYKGKLSFTQKNVDLRTVRNVIANEMNKEVNYNAWCYCCMPMSKINTNNLPLPIFIHMDDVEYGVRNKFEVITLNGISVWHPFFANQRGASIVYYDVRNKLIAMSEFGGVDIREYAKEYLEIFHRSIFNYDYERTIAACRGIEDFCKGIDYFKQIDAISLNSELSVLNKKWQMADEQVEKMICKERPKAFITKAALIKNYLLPNKKDKLVLDCSINDAYPYRVKELWIYNHNTKNYCVFKKSILNMFKAKAACRKAAKLIDRKLIDVSFEWKDRISELTNIEFWKKYLELENE